MSQHPPPSRPAQPHHMHACRCTPTFQRKRSETKRGGAKGATTHPAASSIHRHRIQQTPPRPEPRVQSSISHCRKPAWKICIRTATPRQATLCRIGCLFIYAAFLLRSNSTLFEKWPSDQLSILIAVSSIITMSRNEQEAAESSERLKERQTTEVSCARFIFHYVFVDFFAAQSQFWQGSAKKEHSEERKGKRISSLWRQRKGELNR